jgi:GTPase involved in cell partitioning and DNA repair
VEDLKILQVTLFRFSLGEKLVHSLRALVQQELAMYSPRLPRRPSIIVANKMDKLASAQGYAAIRAATSLPVIGTFTVRAENGESSASGIDLVMNSLRWLLESDRSAKRV